MYPNLIIAGPTKSGSTPVFDCLSAHPDACPYSIEKIGIDPDFYSSYSFDAANLSVVRRSQKIYRPAFTVSRLLPDRLVILIEPICHRMNEPPIPKLPDEDARVLESLRKIYDNETPDGLKVRMRRPSVWCSVTRG